LVMIPVLERIPNKNVVEQAVAKSFQERGWTWDKFVWYSPDRKVKVFWEGSRSAQDLQRSWPWDDRPNHWTLMVCGLATIGKSLAECACLLQDMKTTLDNIQKSLEREPLSRLCNDDFDMRRAIDEL
jgi:hypothetical protein